MNQVQRCPHCGNHVEGKKKKSYASKVGRQGVKSTVHGLTSVGGVGTGAAIGSAFGPIGTILGGAAGWVGSAMFNQAVNSKIDDAADYAEDNLTNVTYEFRCPRCGHSWESHK